MRNLVCKTDTLCVVAFQSHHLTDRYISWLNDPEVVRYSEQRHRSHDRESCRRYVESFSNSLNQFLAIEVSGTLGHIGNITVSFDIQNRLADVSILIGEKSAWGHGYGFQAWAFVLNRLLDESNVRKITAGTMSSNLPMLKLMEKCGMVIEGVRPRHFLLNEVEVDVIYAAKYRVA